MKTEVILCTEEELNREFGPASLSKYYPRLKDTFMEADWLEKQDTYLVDWYKYCVEVQRYLEANNGHNFSAQFNTSLTGFDFDKDGKLSCVELSKEGGAKEKLECDKVVLCLGASTAVVVKKTLGLTIPLVGIKGYSFDLVGDKNDLPVHNASFFLGKDHWYFVLAPI